jgi:hypothetical protein
MRFCNSEKDRVLNPQMQGRKRHNRRRLATAPFSRQKLFKKQCNTGFF